MGADSVAFANINWHELNKTWHGLEKLAWAKKMALDEKTWHGLKIMWCGLKQCGIGSYYEA